MGVIIKRIGDQFSNFDEDFKPNIFFSKGLLEKMQSYNLRQFTYDLQITNIEEVELELDSILKDYEFNEAISSKELVYIYTFCECNLSNSELANEYKSYMKIKEMIELLNQELHSFKFTLNGKTFDFGYDTRNELRFKIAIKQALDGFKNELNYYIGYEPNETRGRLKNDKKIKAVQALNILFDQTKKKGKNYGSKNQLIGRIVSIFGYIESKENYEDYEDTINGILQRSK